MKQPAEDRYTGIMEFGSDTKIFENIYNNLKNSYAVDKNSDFGDSSELEQELAGVFV